MNLEFQDSYFEDEVRDGFYVSSLMKRSWAAQLEVIAAVSAACEKQGILSGEGIVYVDFRSRGNSDNMVNSVKNSTKITLTTTEELK